MFENITLEVSLKPFKNISGSYIRKVCAGVYEQWKPLLKGRKSISVMLWTGDGSEILDYNKNPDDKFEWCRFVGTANLPYPDEETPDETSLHKRKQDYMKNAPEMTYAILRDIVAAFKEEGKRAFPESNIRVGETFDIGPEYDSRFSEVCDEIYGTYLRGEYVDGEIYFRMGHKQKCKPDDADR